MKTIIAATDFSAVSLNAVNYAADMALMLGARLTLFHVYPLPMPGTDLSLPSYSVEEMASDAEKQASDLKELLLRRTGDKIIIHIEVRSGYVLNELADYCSKVQPHAVVMGSESTNKLERFLVGGKTVSAIRQLQWPLIVIPPLVTFQNIRRIGLACDLRDVVESVKVQEIRELVDEFNAELHVLHVSEEPGETFEPETVLQSGLLQEMLGELQPKYHFIKDATIEEGIVGFAERNKIDLLVIVPKKHSLVGRIFRHSHSKELAMHVHVPVMSLHE